MWIRKDDNLFKRRQPKGPIRMRFLLSDAPLLNCFWLAGRVLRPAYGFRGRLAFLAERSN